MIAPYQTKNKYLNAYYGGKVNHMNRTTNNMANVYGSEFNLSTEEIINTIRKVSQIEVIDSTFNPMEVEVALYNNDYYVRPGAIKRRFIDKFGKAFENNKLYRGEADDTILYFLLAIEVLGIIKEFFDEAYFEEQIEQKRRSAKITVNKDKLKMYLKRLDRDELELFLNMVVSCRLECGWFISDVSSTGFWTKIHESCRAAGVNVPAEFDSVEGQKFLNSHKGYYFDTLSTKVIANMLCDAIDLNIEIATSAAKKLYNSGCHAMINYINRKIRI